MGREAEGRPRETGGTHVSRLKHPDVWSNGVGSFFQVSQVDVRGPVLVRPLLLSKVHWQGDGLEVEQPGLEPGLIWDIGGIGGGGLTCYTMRTKSGPDFRKFPFIAQGHPLWGGGCRCWLRNMMRRLHRSPRLAVQPPRLAVQPRDLPTTCGSPASHWPCTAALSQPAVSTAPSPGRHLVPSRCRTLVFHV